MLKVWRGKRGLFVECTDCGSYGKPNHLKPEVRMSPEIEAAVERHTAHMMALRSHYNNAVRPIAEQVRNGSLKRPEGAAKIRVIWQNHVAQVHMAGAALPNPDGKVTEIVSKCPWCDTLNNATEVEKLSDDKSEPEFSLARKQKPVAEHQFSEQGK